MMVEAGIGLGTNLGDKLQNLIQAGNFLTKIDGCKLVSVSSIYETEPVGVPEEYKDITFYNAVMIFNVKIDVEEWSSKVHEIEDKMLRVRSHIRNIPRTIDLDLLYFGDVIKEREHLHLPHPQCTSRRFVCIPLTEVRPDLILPNCNKAISQINSELPHTYDVKKLSIPQWSTICSEWLNAL